MKKKDIKSKLESLDDKYEDDCLLCQMMKEADKRGEVFEIDTDLDIGDEIVN